MPGGTYSEPGFNFEGDFYLSDSPGGAFHITDTRWGKSKRQGGFFVPKDPARQILVWTFGVSFVQADGLASYRVTPASNQFYLLSVVPRNVEQRIRGTF